MRHLLVSVIAALAVACTHADRSATAAEPAPPAAPRAVEAPPAPPPIPPTTAVFAWGPTAGPRDRLDVRFASPPAGFARVAAGEGTFGAMLRALPLQPEGAPVVDFRGGRLYENGAHPNIAAVADLDVGTRDLQHCADAVIRLHAEWRYGRGERDISYRALSGATLSYPAWRTTKGRRDDHAAFRTWLDEVFTWANTASLERDATKVAMKDVRAGDFFVMSGAPFGHAVIVLDVAKAGDGRIALLLGQSYMPAQSFHVLRPSKETAWFVVERDAAFVETPFWKPFPVSALRRLGGDKTARTRTKDEPCAGCAASVPSSAGAPLLVVLHGDSGHGPAELVSAWEPFAAARDVAVLALACPRDRGCNGSWWRWDGDPAWVVGQVDAFSASHRLDRARTWLAGWSGGASYVGMRTQAFEDRFAAIVIHGGGIPPRADGCAKERTPVAFLAGTSNPLHGLAVGLRQHYERCGDDVRWTGLPGADHAAEWRALGDHGGAILDWLLEKGSRAS
jgi:predicted esterase